MNPNSFLISISVDLFPPTILLLARFPQANGEERLSQHKSVGRAKTIVSALTFDLLLDNT